MDKKIISFVNIIIIFFLSLMSFLIGRRFDKLDYKLIKIQEQIHEITNVDKTSQIDLPNSTKTSK